MFDMEELILTIKLQEARIKALEKLGGHQNTVNKSQSELFTILHEGIKNNHETLQLIMEQLNDQVQKNSL